MKKYLRRSKKNQFDLVKVFYNFFFFLVFSILTSCVGLNSYGKFEKRWTYAHPFAALKLKKEKKECDAVYSEVKASNLLDKYENGGELDAFRHVFYMAMFTNKVSAKKVRKLGVAHEKDNYISFLKNRLEDGEKADSLSCAMDLLNNEVGINLIRTSKKNDLKNWIRDLCIDKVQSGNVYFMKRDSLGNYLTCDGTIISLNAYKNVWNVPKCLVQK